MLAHLSIIPVCGVNQLSPSPHRSRGYALAIPSTNEARTSPETTGPSLDFLKGSKCPHTPRLVHPMDQFWQLQRRPARFCGLFVRYVEKGRASVPVSLFRILAPCTPLRCPQRFFAALAHTIATLKWIFSILNQRAGFLPTLRESLCRYPNRPALADFQGVGDQNIF